MASQQAVITELSACRWRAAPGTANRDFSPPAVEASVKSAFGCLPTATSTFVFLCLAGITQRTVRTPGAGAGTAAGRGADGAFGHGAYPCFHAMPESQPVLPCLLRRLLQKGKADAAAALAARHSRCANR